MINYNSHSKNSHNLEEYIGLFFLEYTMKVLDAKVEWNEDIGNRPKLEVLVDDYPNSKSMVYESAENEQLWYAEQNGYVNFFSGSPDESGRGYSGRSFILKTVDGREVTLDGPFSSRAGVMNKKGFGPCVDVRITNDPNVLDKGYTFSSGAITLTKAKEAIEHVEEAEGLRKVSAHGEPIWIPYK